MKLLLSLWLFCFAISAYAADDKPEIVLGTKVLQKKSQPAVDAVQGGSAEHVKCILDDMKISYQIRSLPWRRARQDVHASVIDGFFTAVGIDEASDYATFSAPLALENWYWFWRTDMAAPTSWKEHFQVGVILGSQHEAILTNEGFSEFVTANNVEQLVKLLFSKRVDVVLMDKEQFESTIAKMHVRGRDYKSRFFRYMPLGVYFGAPFLVQHPDFLTAFNSRISACSTQKFELSGSEKEIIKTISAPWLLKIRKNSDIVNAVVRQNSSNKNKSFNQLKKIDEQWQVAFKVGDTKFSKTIVNQNTSLLLKQFSADSNELLSEIIIMDERGYNVAIAEMTSDYWQGDEEKFTQVYSKAEQTIFFDHIKYDASSKRFQVQVSAPFYDAQKKAIGAITLGVDVDKTLSLTN